MNSEHMEHTTNFRVTFDGTLSFRRNYLETRCAVISWDRTDRRLAQLQEHSRTDRRLVQ